MSTYAEIEKQIETELRALAQELDEVDAEEAAEEAKLDSDMQAAAADAKAKVAQRGAEMHAKFDAARSAANQKLEALDQKLTDELQAADAEAAEAQGEAKADLDAQRAGLRSYREKARAQLHASYTAQVKHIESQINQIDAWAASESASVRAKVNTQITALRQQLDAAKQELEHFKQAQHAAWEEGKAKVDRAMADLREDLDEAFADLIDPNREANATTSELLVITYPDQGRAAAVMQELRRLHSQDLVDLEDAGYIIKSPDGRVRLYEAVPLGTKTSTVSRTMWGDLAGTLLMVREPKAALGNLPGAVDDITAKYGFDRDFVTSFIDQMAPESSAICVLVRKSTAENVVLQISKFGGKVLRTSLSKENEAQLEQMLATGPAQANWTLNPGMKVQAKDGDVGKAADIIDDPVTGAHTYLVLESGPLFSKKDVTLPVTAIDWVAENTAHLKLSKANLAQLPSIPAGERDSWAAGYPQNVELSVRLFNDVNTAGKALEIVDDAASVGYIDILNAAVLTKDADGHVKIAQRRDRDIRRSGLFGMLLGALMGVVAGGPAGVVAGAVAGGVAGGGGAALIEAGIPKVFSEALQSRMTPGTSALVIIIEHYWLDNLEMFLNQFGGEMLRQTLTDAMVQEMITPQEAS